MLIRGHYAHEPRVRFADEDPATQAPSEASPRSSSAGLAVPYRLRLPAGWVPGDDTLARLLDLAGDDGYGLVSVLLAEGERRGTGRCGRQARSGPGAGDRRGTAGAYRRVRARRDRAGGGEDLDDAVEDTFGVIWVDGETYGFASEARHISGRRGAHRARIEAEAEVARLTRETERLRGQVTRWRDEAGRWRRSAVELRREVGTLRRELAAARKVVQYGLLSSVKRAITRRR